MLHGWIRVDGFHGCQGFFAGVRDGNLARSSAHHTQPASLVDEHTLAIRTPDSRLHWAPAGFLTIAHIANSLWALPEACDSEWFGASCGLLD